MVTHLHEQSVDAFLQRDINANLVWLHGACARLAFVDEVTVEPNLDWVTGTQLQARPQTGWGTQLSRDMGGNAFTPELP